MFWALHHDPPRLSPELRRVLTWEAATERLMAASTLTEEMQANSKALADKFCEYVHHMVSSFLILMFC